LKVFAIQGQHDFAVPSWTSAASEHIIHVDKQIFEPCPGFSAYGLDNLRDSERVKEEVAKVPRGVSTLVCHQMFREVFNMEGVWNIDTAWLPEHVQYVLVGDYHEPVTFKGAHNVEAWYSGSMYMCKLDEPPAKSFMVVHVADDGKMTVERVPIKSRAFIFLAIKNEDELAPAKKLLESLDLSQYDTDLTPVVVVDYMATIPNIAATLTPLCKDKILWLRPVTIRIMDNVKGEANLVHKTMADCLPTYKKSVDAATYALLADLLADSDTSAVIAKHKKLILPEEVK
jgi:DNA repair exonuclease SbcCD nuclease subunit